MMSVLPSPEHGGFAAQGLQNQLCNGLVMAGFYFWGLEIKEDGTPK